MKSKEKYEYKLTKSELESNTLKKILLKEI